MDKILEHEVIYNAFMDTILGKLPRKKENYPDWFKDRLEKCDGCKYNTKNIPNSMLPTDLYISKMLGKPRCSICTCFIKQKAWSKTEQCAMGETKKRPDWITYGQMNKDNREEALWNRMELITLDKDLFNLISDDHEKYNTDLSEDKAGFDINLGNIPRGSDADFTFTLESRKPIQLRATHASCSCTVPKVQHLDDKHIRFNIHITCGKFGKGEFDRTMTVDYGIKGTEETGSIMFHFKANIYDTPESIAEDEERHKKAMEEAWKRREEEKRKELSNKEKEVENGEVKGETSSN